MNNKNKFVSTAVYKSPGTKDEIPEKEFISTFKDMLEDKSEVNRFLQEYDEKFAG